MAGITDTHNKESEINRIAGITHTQQIILNYQNGWITDTYNKESEMTKIAGITDTHNKES